MLQNNPILLSLMLLAKTSLFAAGCLLVGRAVREHLESALAVCAEEQTPGSLVAFIDISLGMGLLTMALFLLGISSMLSTPITGLVVFLMLGASVFQCRRSFASVLSANTRSWFPAWTKVAQYLFFAGLLILVILLAVNPPGHWDDTSYHLPYARYYVENHAIAINPYLRFPLFAHNGDLLFSLALMYGSTTDAQALATLPLFVIALGLFGAGQVFAWSALVGYLAVLLYFTLGPVGEALGYAYIDNTLALYCWGTVVSFAMWLRDSKRGIHWLVICAILAGTATGTKLFGGVVAVMVGLYLLACVRQTTPTVLYALITLLFGIGWYARSFYISGDPVHPLGGNIFGHFLWNAADLASAAQEQGTHGADKNFLHVITAFQKAGVLPLLPALLFVAHPQGRHKPLLFVYFIFVLYLLFWFFSSQVSRYLAPSLPAGAFLCALFLYHAVLKGGLRKIPAAQFDLLASRIGALALVAAGIGMVFWGAQRVPSQLANWEARLKGRAGYDIMTAANELMPQHGNVMVQVGYENAVYFFKGTLIGDWFGPGRYSGMLHCAERCEIASAEHMASVMNGFGAQMLAVNAKRFLFDPQQYTDLFEIRKQSEDGYLLTLKSQH